MGVRNPKREELRRLASKSLDAQFTNIVREGLGCSPFEAEAVLEAVKEVYAPFLDEASPQAPPGKVSLVAVCADEPAGKSVAECAKRTVCLTVHRGPQDDRLLQENGSRAFRRARIPDLCQEALSQGALLTREDLAYHIFFCHPGTISRDLAFLRQQEPRVPVPLRSTVHDIGPVLTHRVEIVRLALQGKTTSQICAILRHSPAAVTNYLWTFARCAYLAQQGMQAGQIAFLLRRGQGLVRLCHQAFEQGGLLSNCDLAELLAIRHSDAASLLVEHEERTGQVVPRRATVHDVGTALTHKRLICRKRYLEAKPPEQVARETYHSLEAVDRYLGTYDRVRHCRLEGLAPDAIAYTLDCSRALVEQYLAIDDELEAAHA